MLRAILCDDNEIILEGLETQIDWIALGIEVTGTACNGEDAWDLIRKQSPDILITDIRMPYMDGLVLAEKARELNNNLSIVIISGYDDFEYARTAMRLGISEYILKPIDLKEMERILTAAAAHCRQLFHGRHIKAVELFKDLLYRNLTGTELLRRCAIAQIDPSQYCSMMQIELNTMEIQALSEDIQYSVEHKFSHLSEEFEKSDAYVIETSYNKYLLLFCSPTKAGLATLETTAIDKVRKIFPPDGHYDIVIAAGNQYSGLANVRYSMSDCAKALKIHFIKGSNATIYYKEVAAYIKACDGRKLTSNDLDIDFLTPLKSHDKPGLLNQLELLKSRLMDQGGNSFLYMALTVGALYSQLVRELGESGINIRDAFENPIDEFKKVTAPGTLDAVIDNLKQSLFKICDCIIMNKSRYGRLIDQALRYIQAHYANPSLSIDEVAHVVSLSPSYFSTIFKNETGDTFTDYLIHLRMDKAKDLLRNTDLKIYEISSKAGYENAAYFSAAFKRYTGIAPSEYQN